MPDILKNIGIDKLLISAILVAGTALLFVVGGKFFRKFRDNTVVTGQLEADRKTRNNLNIVWIIARVLIVIILVLVILQINGIDVRNLITSMSLIGAAIAVALQDVFKDFVMGIRIVTEHFYGVGDVVKYHEIEAVVVNFGLMTTELRNTVTGEKVILCNRNINEITKSFNLTDLDLGLSYDEDPAHVHAVLGAICEKIRQLKGIDNCIYKGTQSFEDSCIIYKIRFYCDPADRPESWRRVLRLVQDELLAAGIRIPYNQMDIHMKEK